MSISENLQLNWINSKDKLPEDGDSIYFQVGKRIYTGYFNNYINLENNKKIQSFEEDERDNSKTIKEVSYWSYIPIIKGIQ